MKKFYYIIQMYFTLSSIFKSFDFNFNLNKLKFLGVSLVLDRTLLQSEGPLKDILYFDW